MGTNYYLSSKPCDHCGAVKTRRHIGKSSHGWVFALRIHPEDGINSWNDWLPLLESEIIENEYGDSVSFDELRRIVTERWIDRNGKSRVLDAYESQHAEHGPNGLLRAKVGRYCVAHGPGTLDLHNSEFS